MKKYPFSYEAIREVYDLENRKGKITLDILPESYQNLIHEINNKRDELKKLSHQSIKTLDDDAKAAHFNNIANLKDEISNLLKEKDKQLDTILHQVEKIICSKNYHYEIQYDSNYINHKAEFFHVKRNGIEDVIMTKLLCSELSSSFKVKAGDRHYIMSVIKELLIPGKNFHIIRTDVENFFENINQEVLMTILNGNPHLSKRSIGCIKSILLQYEEQKSGLFSKPGNGVPRGIGLSSILSEIYLRDLDIFIKSMPNVLFYARYVDDIFIILTHLEYNSSPEHFLQTIQTSEYLRGLKLHTLNSGKTQIVEDSASANNVDITYLGYKICFENNERGKNIFFRMSDKRIEKLKSRIDNAISFFEKRCNSNPRVARKTLFDCLNLISANMCLHKAKHGIKVGISYNNDLMSDENKQLNSITSHLRTQIRSINLPINPFGTVNGRDAFMKRLIDKVNKVDFYQRWKDKKTFSFTILRMAALSRIIGV